MTNEKIKILLGVDGFKLHNMDADKLLLNSWGEPCGRKLFLSFVQIMKKIILFLNRRQAKMVKDSASNHEIGLFTQY